MPFLGSSTQQESFSSTLFHCAGGAAGSVALVTGSIGNALAVLSFDEDYQKVSALAEQHHSFLCTTLTNTPRSSMVICN